MISMPASATALPVKSHGVGRTPSTSHSQTIAVATYTPPYAAYTRPEAVGCSASSATSIATTKGFQLILDRASDNGIIFASPSIDISNEVLSKLGYDVR